MLKFFTMFSGSSGNCSYITNGRTRILIDAGVSCTRICAALDSAGETADDLSGLIITHSHRDHIGGVDVLCRRRGVPLYAAAGALDNMNISDGVYERAIRIDVREKFSIGDITVTAFPTPHDAPDSMGFVFEDESGARLGYASDLGHISFEIETALLGCEGLYIESNHDVDMLMRGMYPYSLKRRILGEMGHLSNDACADFLAKACAQGTKHIILGHLSRENNMPRVAYETSAARLLDAGVHVGRDISLSVAPVDLRSEVIEL